MTALVVALGSSSTAPQAQTAMVIDWSVCTQPIPGNEEHTKGVESLEQRYVAEASRASHVAVGLNKVYGVAVQERRDHVRLNYIPLGPRRTEKQCALSPANYAKLLQYRDASYYVMCRGEVGIGATDTERAAKDLKAMVYAAIYDLAKAGGIDMRAKADEPTTPPGGFEACRRGAREARKDPFPKAADVAAFKSRMIISDSEKAKLGDPTKQ